MKPYCLILMSICILCSCRENRLAEVLSRSKENRVELDKVLEHYKGDSLKLEAAKFLICHLPGNVAYDSTHIGPYRSFLLLLDSLKKEERADAFDLVNDQWNQFARSRSVGADVYSSSSTQQDLYTITSDYLIDNVDRAFEAWERTPYKDSIDFDTFLRYILPYRKKNGYVIEPWRNYFLSRYGDYSGRFSSPHEAVDSLLELVSDYTVNGWAFKDYPYISLRDYNLSKVSRCGERCWFNSMLLSAFGVPCAIDFVPAWGNRNSNHEWNAIIVGGKTCAFEATGGGGKWKAQRVYDNICVDEYWMKSRLPKVFRHRYESADEGPSTDASCNGSNTPSLFLSSKFQDVSQEYFLTSDIEIPVKEGTELDLPTEYAYLFVFNANVWKPVYWGRVKSGKARFERMGRDQVYLAGFYDRGRVVPFNAPFLLRPDGSIHYLAPDVTRRTVVTPERKYYARPDIDFWKNWNVGARVESGESPAFRHPQSVFTIPACESRPNLWVLDEPVSTRYLRYLFPENLDALAELSFFSRNKSGALDSLRTTIFSSDKRALNQLQKVFDRDILTYADLNGFRPEGEGSLWVGVDFGRRVEVAAISLCPRNDKNNVIKGLEYELFYWDNGWLSLGRQVATDYQLKYTNVPDNALLFLKCTTEGSENRIFTWDGKKQVWW